MTWSKRDFIVKGGGTGWLHYSSMLIILNCVSFLGVVPEHRTETTEVRKSPFRQLSDRCMILS